MKRAVVFFALLVWFTSLLFASSRGLFDFNAGAVAQYNINSDSYFPICGGADIDFKLAFLGLDATAMFCPAEVGRSVFGGMFDFGLKFDIAIIRIGFSAGWKYWMGPSPDDGRFSFSFNDPAVLTPNILDGPINLKLTAEVLIKRLNVGAFAIVSTGQCLRTFSIQDAIGGFISGFNKAQIGVRCTYNIK